MRDRITTARRAKLGSVSLLGESAVDITPSTAGTPIPEWGYVPPGRRRRRLPTSPSRRAQGVDEITELVTDIRARAGARSAS